MKQVLGGLSLFILGVVVGTAGSDDSLLKDAPRRESMAYRRGYAAGKEDMQAAAIQTGSAKWMMNPHTGQADLFIWQGFQSKNVESREGMADRSRDAAEGPWGERPNDGV